MTARTESLIRPSKGEDFRATSRWRTPGFVLAAVGVALATVTLIANIAAASTDGIDAAAATLAWSFGLTTMAFATLKLGIALILIGILKRLWLRIESVKEALPDLMGAGGGGVISGPITTPYGPALASAATPARLPIHRIARTMWGPMLAMGSMAVIAGLIVSLVSAGNTDSVAAAAWTQGLQFLGEGMLLAGISFLLGTILSSLREGGGAVQESLGLTVKTLEMPRTAKVFVGLMVLGVMLAVFQFILYLVVAGGIANPTAWFAWLGPLREFALGTLLAGIVLALVTIGNVLGFQFDRIKEIVATGS